MTADEIRNTRVSGVADDTGYLQEIAAQFAEFNETTSDMADYLLDIKQTLEKINLCLMDMLS